jgi:hypothetical protein
MAFNIKSKSGRSSLPARREAYWSRVRTGLYVGYRKLKVGEGTWIARRQENGEKQYRALGTITDEGAFDHAVAIQTQIRQFHRFLRVFQGWYRRTLRLRVGVVH